MPVDAKAIEEFLHREPFRPFRIITSSGKEYDVRNPALVVVMKRDVFYAYPGKEDFTIISLTHVASVDTIQQAA